jgi:hypothetical protein
VLATGSLVNASEFVSIAYGYQFNQFTDLHHSSFLYGFFSSLGDSSSTMFFGSFQASATYFV